MNEKIKINWYRSKVDKQLMKELMQTSDAKALCHVLLQLGLFALTGAITYMAFLNIHGGNWFWALPLMLVALFVHCTFASFIGIAVPQHELCHKTPFRTKAVNEFFLHLYGFIGWVDFIGFRISHVKHHQVTVHDDLDGEVVLPSVIDIRCIRWLLELLTVNPVPVFNFLRSWVEVAWGDGSKAPFGSEWMRKVLDDAGEAARKKHRRWAQFQVLGHLALAVLFVATGHWFLIVLFTLACFPCRWLSLACGMTQHMGMTNNVADFRLCCRTFTCGPLLGFLYWNMQYHVEHHMFPAVPFYNLPRLREAIEHDLPPATHGLWATWKELIPIVQRQKADPTWSYRPVLPTAGSPGELVSDEALQREAAAGTA